MPAVAAPPPPMGQKDKDWSWAEKMPKFEAIMQRQAKEHAEWEAKNGKPFPRPTAEDRKREQESQYQLRPLTEKEMAQWQKDQAERLARRAANDKEPIPEPMVLKHPPQNLIDAVSLTLRAILPVPSPTPVPCPTATLRLDPPQGYPNHRRVGEHGQPAGWSIYAEEKDEKK